MDSDEYQDDDWDDTGDEGIRPEKPPAVDPSPDTSAINENDLSTEIQLQCGQFGPVFNCGRARPLPYLIHQRENGSDGRRRCFTASDRRAISCSYLPTYVCLKLHFSNKVFCGTYSQDGKIFLSACQDRKIRVYDTTFGRFKEVNCIQARDVGWSILDLALSPDGNYLVYSSWAENLHITSVLGHDKAHHPLPLFPDTANNFCIFSVVFSQDNKELLGGANDGCLYVYDRHRNERTLRVEAHDDDVNAVAFADDSSHILYSGSDDGLCKGAVGLRSTVVVGDRIVGGFGNSNMSVPIAQTVQMTVWHGLKTVIQSDLNDQSAVPEHTLRVIWDRRTLRESNPCPVAVMAGHLDGITFIDSKGDGRYFLSNSKDQTIKLWDIRSPSDHQVQEAARREVSKQNWDYRWQQVPQKVVRSRTRIPGDSSLMTYRGHSVLNTLLRARFSPMFTTGQRYIYSGCATGTVLMYEVLTGRIVEKLRGHAACVRDVSWHPYDHNLVSSSWDCTILKWWNCEHGPVEKEPTKARICPWMMRPRRAMVPQRVIYL